MTTLRGVTVVIGLAALLMALSFHPYLGDYGDDAEFVILGQGLARGDGYAWINSPDHPAHNRYPPGYPLALAGTMLATGTARDALAAVTPSKVVTAATLLAATVLLWRFARRRLPAWWAPGAVALFALSPISVRFGVQTMSDVPYLPLLLGGLLWVEAAPTKGSRGHWFVAGALLAAGAYVRSIGLPAAVGVLGWAIIMRRPNGFVAASTFIVLMTPWWLRDATLAGGWRYLQELTSAVYQDPDAGAISPGGLLARALDNAAFVADKPATLGVPGVAVAVACAALVALGARRSALTWGGAAECAAATVCLAVLFWPIKTGRYLLPVTPLAGVYAVAGALEVGDWLAGNSAARTAWKRSACAVLVATCAAFTALSARDGARNIAALRRGGGPAGYYADRPDWAHYLEAASWLRENAAQTDVAMARRHFALYVYSGHFVDKYRYDTSEDELAYLTAGTTRKYVVEDGFDYLRGDFAPLSTALRARGGDLRLRYETDVPRVRVWELIRSR